MDAAVASAPWSSSTIIVCIVGEHAPMALITVAQRSSCIGTKELLETRFGVALY